MGAAGRPSRFAPSNWRVRWRLAAVIAIPTIAAAVLGAIEISTNASDAAAFGRVQTLANLNAAVVTLTQKLEDERDITASYVANGRMVGYDTQNGNMVSVKEAQGNTSNWAHTVQQDAQTVLSGSGFQPGTVQDLQQLVASLSDLPNIRTVAISTKFPPSDVIRAYTTVIDNANTFSGSVGNGANDADLQGNVTTLTALLREENQMSRQRAILSAALGSPTQVLGPEDLSSLEQAQTEQAADQTDFNASASETEQSILTNTLAGTQVDSASAEEALAESLAAKPNTLLTSGGSNLNAQAWFGNMSAEINKARAVAEGGSQGVAQASGLVSQITTRANTLKSNSQRNLLVAAIATALVLGLVLLISTMVARSLTRPLRKLRSDALDVAGHRLPDMVRRLSQSEGADEGVEIEPIGVNSTDEIGEVARAFDQVHREAVRLAADEAMLRGNLNAMFINLSRRSQSLIERQLSLIDSLEQSEQDPGRLSSLFRLDHLATRMRRNSENLLVLAGHEVARRWSQPVPLVDVLRAAISEIEQYERVVLNVQPGIVVVGQAVNDVVHLVAEIVENATTFSPEDTQVYVSGQPLSSGGVLLDITDNGVGISDQEMSHANWRLDNPPVVDVAVSRRMGLFVVGRLAARHGVRVRLRHAQAGGLTALIWLPETVAAPEVAPPLGRLRKFDADDYGPAPSLSAPTATSSTATSQATAAARIPRFSSGSGQGSSPSFTPTGPSAQPTPLAPQPVQPSTGPQPAQGVPPLPVRNAGATAPADTSNGMPTGPSRLPSFGQSPAEDDNDATTSMPRVGAGLGGFGDEFTDAYANGNGNGNGNGAAIQDQDPSTVTIPPAAAQDQRLPIFDSLESDWFRRSGKTMGTAAATTTSSRGTGPQQVHAAATTQTWTSPADEGWRAAQVVAAPSAGETTQAGLPKRVPRANLVPGSVGGGGQDAERTASAAPARTADDVRARLSSFQRGVREGRAAAPQIEEQ